MTKTTFQKEVTLEGYQTIFKASKFGYSLTAHINQEMVDKLIVDREELVEWCKSKLKNPRNFVATPEPWDKRDSGDYKVKFSWNEKTKPIAYDCDLNEVDDKDIPLHSCNQVEILFHQKLYILKDGVTYGTSLTLLYLQVITISKNEWKDYALDDTRYLFRKKEG